MGKYDFNFQNGGKVQGVNPKLISQVIIPALESVYAGDGNYSERIRVVKAIIVEYENDDASKGKPLTSDSDIIFKIQYCAPFERNGKVKESVVNIGDLELIIDGEILRGSLTLFGGWPLVDASKEAELVGRFNDNLCALLRTG